jgi:hypothetical protein
MGGAPIIPGAAAEEVLTHPGQFVGSHPLVGSEKRGVAFSEADLFNGANCLMTPTSKTSEVVKKKVRQLWTMMGANVELVSPKEHDEALAYVSHLPHLVAYSLMESVPQKRVKTVVNVNLVNLLAQAMAAIQSLFSENEKNKYSQLLKRYIDLTKVSEVNSGVAIEGVPDSEIEKEIFQVDRLKETNDFNLVKYVQDSLYFTIQRILESKINFLKEKIKSGENVEENLKEIQNLTRLNMNSKKEIYG